MEISVLSTVFILLTAESQGNIPEQATDERPSTSTLEANGDVTSQRSQDINVVTTDDASVCDLTKMVTPHTISNILIFAV